MEILVNSRQMKQCDSNIIHHYKVPSLVLMERAALCIADEVEKRLEKGSRILVVCGTGNNGGDGLAAARILCQRSYKATIVLIGASGKVSEETAAQLAILHSYGIPVESEIPEIQYDGIIDALLGIGLTRELQGSYRMCVEQLNRMAGIKIAADIPSGIHSDTGAVMGAAFRADVTVTFAFRKIGTLLFPGAEYAGTVIVREIGIGTEGFLDESPKVFKMESKDLMGIPVRKPYSNKGSYGKVLAAAGHKNMSGAAFFSGKAAYAAGAGLVKLYTEEYNRVILQQQLPEAVLTTYNSADWDEEELKREMEWATVIAAGPGIGTAETARNLIHTILKYAKVPVVLDADGLNITAAHKEWLKNTTAPVIVTPHLGEMGRLVNKSIFDIQKQLLQVAQSFATEYNVICVLKDTRTVTALPDGRSYINDSGNNGMATAGAGDVLTGIIAGLLAQGMKPEDAAVLGVYLHGCAGDRKVEETGTYSLTAGDLIQGISKVMKK